MTPDLRERLITLGYYWGETYYFDPNKPTMCWLQSDFAGSAWPVNDDERIALLTVIDAHECAALPDDGREGLPPDDDDLAVWSHSRSDWLTIAEARSALGVGREGLDYGESSETLTTDEVREREGG